MNCLKRNVEERPDVETLLMDPFVDDSLNEKMCRAPALKYEQHDGSYSNFPDNQSLVSSQVSLDDPSEETDVDDDDDGDDDDDDDDADEDDDEDDDDEDDDDDDDDDDGDDDDDDIGGAHV